MFGYSPGLLETQIKISGKDYQEVEDFAKKMEENSKTWGQIIKKCYQESFEFTHFVRTELSNFITNCFEGNFQPQIRRLFDIDKKTFDRNYDELFSEMGKNNPSY